VQRSGEHSVLEKIKVLEDWRRVKDVDVKSKLRCLIFGG
jgi:hypothetical protein